LNKEPKQRQIGGLLIGLGVTIALIVYFGLRHIHAHARWFLNSRWGPDGQYRQDPDAYDQLYKWATHATEKGIFTEQLCGYICAALLVILGLVCRAWAHDKAVLTALNNENE